MWQPPACPEQNQAFPQGTAWKPKTVQKLQPRGEAHHCRRHQPRPPGKHMRVKGGNQVWYASDAKTFEMAEENGKLRITEAYVTQQ